MPIALSLFVAVRLSLGSMDDAKNSWMLIAVRVAIALMLLLGFLSIGIRSQWIALVWLVVMGIMGLLLLWKRIRMQRDALLLSAMQAENLQQQQSLLQYIRAESFLWLKWKASSLASDLAIGRQWPVALEVRSVATGVYEKLALRLRCFYGDSDQDQLEASQAISPLQIEAEAERLIGRLMLLVWTATLLPVIIFYIVNYVIPTFKEMFEEFGLDLPDTMLTTISFSDMAAYSGLGFLMLLVPPLLLGIAFFALLIWICPFLLQTPVFRWICPEYFNNLGFAALSRVVEEERDLGKAFEVSANVIPVSFVANRYRAVALHLRQGEELESAVAKAGIIKSSELALFRETAETADLRQDPIWCLRQLASWRVERMLTRYGILVQVAVVVLVTLMAIIAGMFAIGVMSSLSIMIQSLA
ncbi:MAG: hypothetical protein AAF483_01410 [Planctomycetota bacterium]